MGLGWLRLLLSLLVIDAHYGGFRLHVQPRLVDMFGIERLAYVGQGGVAIAGFFVISGYVITYVLARKYDTSSWRGIGLFYLGRGLRIYPLYLLLFTVYWLTLTAIGAAPGMRGTQLVDNLLLLPLGIESLLGDHDNLGPMQLTGQLLIGPAWTLCLDLLLYVLAPFMVLNKRVLWLVWALGLAWFVAFIVTLDPRPPLWFAYLYTSPLAYTFAFACGALVFHYGNRVSGNRVLLAAMFVALIWLTFLPLGLTNTAGNQLLAILALTLVVAALKDYGSGRRWDRFFGDLTYATYLLHLPLLLLLERLAVAGAPWWGLLLTYGIAGALLFGFEYPLDRWRDQLHRRLSAAYAHPARPARWLPWASAAVLGVISAAALASFVRNGLGGGTAVLPVVAQCPATWQCATATGALTVSTRGAGAIALDPALPTDARVLADVAVRGASGSGFAGFRMGGSGGLEVGLRRHGERCDLVVMRGGALEPVPGGWNADCTRVHRFVLDGSTGAVVLAVDSLWVYATGQAAQAARLVVEADAASDGETAISGIYTTSRRGAAAR